MDGQADVPLREEPQPPPLPPQPGPHPPPLPHAAFNEHEPHPISLKIYYSNQSRPRNVLVRLEALPGVVTVRIATAAFPCQETRSSGCSAKGTKSLPECGPCIAT